MKKANSATSFYLKYTAKRTLSCSSSCDHVLMHKVASGHAHAGRVQEWRLSPGATHLCNFDHVSLQLPV